MAVFVFQGKKYSPQELLRHTDVPAWLSHVQAAVEFWFGKEDALKVFTSGSTGVPKPMMLSRKMIEASARATINFYKLQKNQRAALVLPAAFVGGKMMIFRALMAGLEIHLFEPKTSFDLGENTFDFVPLTPMQAAASFSQLKKVNKLLLGGAPVSRGLEENILNEKINAWHSYGMTETASHVALRPLGSRVFEALTGVSFGINMAQCLVIHAPAWGIDSLQTNDVVDLKTSKSFIWLGRKDWVINSGGVKLYPELIEEKLAHLFNGQNFMVAGIADELLGEKLIVVAEGVFPEKINFDFLPKLERPKEVRTIPKFVYTENGKINRLETLNLIKN